MSIECKEQYDNAIKELFEADLVGNTNSEYIKNMVKLVKEYEANGLMTNQEKEELSK